MFAVRRQIGRRSSSLLSFRGVASSFFESDPTLIRGNDGPTVSEDKDFHLRTDVRTMGSMLGQVIEENHGKDIFDKIEKLRHLAKVCVCVRLLVCWLWQYNALSCVRACVGWESFLCYPPLTHFVSGRS